MAASKKKRAFQSAFGPSLLKRLASENTLRTKAQEKQGQLLILDNLKDFEKALKEQLGVNVVDPRVIARALAAGKKKALKLQNDFRKSKKDAANFKRMSEKKRRIPGLEKYRLGTDIFLVRSFYESLPAIKKEILDVLQAGLNLGEEDSAKLSKNMHRGHGESGNAIASLDVASGISASGNKTKLKEIFDERMAIEGKEIFGDRLNEVNELFSTYNQIVTPKGEIRSSYLSVISFQYSIDNSKDGVEEKAMKTAFRQFIEDIRKEIPGMTGSSSLQDKIAKVVINNIKPKGAKSKEDPAVKAARLATKGRVTVKNGKVSKPRMRVLGVASSSSSSKPRFRVKAGVASGPLILLALINQRLPSEVADNMGSPALNYRTGRFASSVKAITVNKTTEGFPSIAYTYMRDPYQTFEPGNAMGSTDRDPRVIINKSIREIAAEFAIGRFYTRRV